VRAFLRPEWALERRLLFVALCWTCVLGGISVRLWRIQVARSAELTEIANSQYQDKIPILPDRGLILDRNGEALALSLDCVSVVANPSQVDDPEGTAVAVATLLGESARAIRPRLEAPTRFEWLERKVSPAVGEAIERLALPGIYTIPDKERVHPAGRCFTPVVGTTDTDGKGTEGVELWCDSLLTGRMGGRVLQRVAGAKPRPNMLWESRSPEAGRSVVLTLDTRLQRIVEAELADAVAAAAARRGLAVVLDPHNGEVLAMAAVCGSAESRAGVRPAMNLITGTQFEPGSTFKVVAYAAALERQLFRPTDLLNAEGGVWSLGSMVIHDEEKNGLITFTEAFEHSSNICAAKIAMRVGDEDYYRMARRFGFGTRTGVDLPGEIPGLLRRPDDWSARSLATLAFGYEVSVTALQLASAYAAIANGGILYEPRIIKEIVDRKGRTLHAFPTRPIRRVVSPETARVLRQLMEGVVVEGTAKGAYLDRWAIAGKTGTARKAAEQWRGYDRSRIAASFAGFFPAWDPQLVAVVVIDEPQGGIRYGGLLAAPAFRSMVERFVNTAPVPLVTSAAPMVGPMPPADSRDGWEGFRAGRMPRAAVASDSASAADGDAPARRDATVLAHADTSVADGEAGAHAEAHAAVAADSLSDAVVVPDVRGGSLRLGLRAMRAAGLEPVVQGSGIVTGHDPAPGTLVARGARIVLRGSPPQPAEEGAGVVQAAAWRDRGTR
jgi:cell division protein FtsI (penicillin-binding protein 3)